jgi:hypothetical protein
LLCSEIVELKNEQDVGVRRRARLADVDAAVPEALAHGRFFFEDIQHNQVDGAGLSVLRYLAAQAEGAVVDKTALDHRFPNAIDQTLGLLLRRGLIERVGTDSGGRTRRPWHLWLTRRAAAGPPGEQYRFQVELIRRWIADSAK